MSTITLPPPSDGVDEAPEFRFDIKGRIRNLSLPASQTNALIPLFEAISNAIHAIEARFDSQSMASGQISVEVLRSKSGKDASITSFVVRDNGTGLTDENMDSFRTSDSPFKIKKGGKGVGRLSWLKTFQKCEIKSWFMRNDRLLQRSFTFSLETTNPISKHTVITAPANSRQGTEVRLDTYVSPYDAYCPKKITTIAAKIVGHFLNYFVVERAPLIQLSGEREIELRDFYTESQERNNLDLIRPNKELLGSDQELQIYHVLLRKQLKFHETGGLHWLFQAGNNRVARQDAIDGQIGIKYVGDNSDCIYVGLVAGPFLDEHVNQERTGFTFTHDIASEIHKEAITSTKNFLGNYIADIRKAQRETAIRVIRDNPQFLPFADDIDEFVTNHLSLSTQGEEDIFLELSRRRLRAKRRVRSEINQLDSTHENFEEKISEISKALNDEKKGSLAEYVVRRKEILDLLDAALQFEDVDTDRYAKEEYLHKLIIPLRSSSDELDYSGHNLWVLDDRLSFYSFFRSDKAFSTFVDVESRKEPDIAIVFDRAFAFQREGTDDSIVIVEFKRPGRDDFTGNTNPVTQVLEYVDLFRSGTAIKDRNGRIIKPINESTRFICFVVADFTDTLKRAARLSVANNSTADGQGFFGYSQPHNAFIEVLPYSKMIHDAKLRNEAFFAKLGLL